MYCRENHCSSALCLQCSVLMEYTQQRLEKCPFQEGKKHALNARYTAIESGYEGENKDSCAVLQDRTCYTSIPSEQYGT